MHHKIKQNSKVLILFAVTFLLAFFTPSLYADNAKTSVLEYGSKSTSVEDDVVRFHLEVNKLTNDFLKKLIKEDKPNVDYPLADEECSKDNVSTFCLASILNEELTSFEIGMLAQKKRFKDPSDTRNLSLDDAIKNQSDRSLLIDGEVQSAKKAIDLTLAVYNEAQLAYPVHKELTYMIKNIEEYRDNLSKVRDSVELFPGEFNDASTAQCK